MKNRRSRHFKYIHLCEAWRNGSVPITDYKGRWFQSFLRYVYFCSLYNVKYMLKEGTMSHFVVVYMRSQGTFIAIMNPALGVCFYVDHCWHLSHHFMHMILKYKIVIPRIFFTTEELRVIDQTYYKKILKLCMCQYVKFFVIASLHPSNYSKLVNFMWLMLH